MELMKKLKHINLLFFLKTGIGSAVAIILAGSLGLAYSPSAGIITLLTIQNTKKETLQIAIRRVIAFVVALLITYLMFQCFGYHSIAFGGFVFLFVALCTLFDLKDGISMNAVLMTHFLIEKNMKFSFILNEAAILFIGMSIGIILNLIMPRYREKIRREQLELEEEIKKALHCMAQMLKQKECNTDFHDLENLLERLLKRAYEEAGNTLLSNTKYLISYLEMRKSQLGVLKDIANNIKNIPVILEQSIPLSEFIDSIQTNYHELNDVLGLLEELEELKEYYRKDQLPKTREEFEYRATLFQILKDLEYFLLLKRNFVIELDRKL